MCRSWIDIDTLEIWPEWLSLISTKPDSKKTIRKTSDDLRRARELHRGVELALGSDTDMVISETTFFSKSSSAMKSAGISLGVLGSLKVPLIEITAMDSKVEMTGVKTADKKAMINAAVKLYPDLNWLRDRKGKLVNDNEHLADAVAAIHAGVKSSQFLDALAIYRAARPKVS